MEIISFRLPHVFEPGSNPVDNAYALRVLLECLVGLNLAYLSRHDAPDLYRSGVRYGRTTEWDPIPALYQRRYGDCKSLSAALIAQYRMAGVDASPVFRFIPRARDGWLNFHILVQTAKGFEDPSKVLGMGQNENAHFNTLPGSTR